MKKVLVSCLLLSLWLSLYGSGAWAIDVGWMQQGVRVWYFGSAGTVSSSDAEEAYLFTSISGNTATLTHNSGINHWSLPTAETETGSIIDKGPFWIHPQVLQNITIGDNWMGIDIKSMNRATYTYDTFKNNAEFTSIPYLLLPIKALFDFKPQREIVKLVYGNPNYPDYDPVWGTAYFDAETGLCLFNLKLTLYNTVWFILSEINYNFANQTAFAEDNGPHTGFMSFVSEQQISSHGMNSVLIQSSVETRYGSTVQMWTSTSENGLSLPNENYCFFGSVPVLRHKLMSATPNYPPENWNAYGEYLWWWVPAGVLQNSAINVFNVPMTRTSTNPYTFTATQQPTGFFFTKLWFDNDGYMTAFAAKDSTTGLDIDPGYTGNATVNAPGSPAYFTNETAVYGLSYYKDTMGIAVPVGSIYRLTMTVVSDTAGKGGGSVHGDGNISCSGHGSSPSGMSGNCQADFASGTNVNLYQTPDSDSTWATWTGPVPGCGTGQSCQVLMNGARNVTVTFPYSFMAKVSSSNQGYDSLALAYGNAGPLDTIYGRAVTFTEDFTLSGSKAITLLGGRDAWYLPQNAWTTLQGILAIRGGSLTVERLVIK